MYCPDCGRKYNDPGMRFCPYCTIPLAKKRPLFGFSPPWRKSTPAPLQPAQKEFAPASKHPDSIRRAYILATILLLLIACFCGLLLTERMEVPGFVAPFVEPYLDDLRELFRNLIDLPIPVS